MDEQLPPRAPSAVGRIKPAGWIALALLLGGIGFGVWKAIGLLPKGEPAPVNPTEPVTPPVNPPVVPPAVPSADRVVPTSLLPREARSLPEVKGTVARAVAGPSNLVDPGASGITAVDSDSAALDRLVAGTSDVAIVSVASLAARPDAVKAGVKAAWLVGYSPLDAGLFPSCDRRALTAATLGVVGRSAAHLHLVAALAGEKLPKIETLDGENALDQAIAEARVNGGALRLAREGGTLPRPACQVLPRAFFALVVVRRADRPLSDAEVASLVALSRAPVAPEDVGAFFDPSRSAPGGFREVFETASRIWKAAGVIDRAASASDAVDRTFVEPAPRPTQPSEPTAARTGLGYPSWLDRSALR